MNAAEAFVSAVLTEDFWEVFWEKKPFLCRKTNLREWLTVDEVLAILAVCGPEGVRVFKNSASNPSNNPFTGYLDGGSIIVNTADRFSPQLQSVCRCLTASFFYHAFSVLYLTPPSSQAVRLHSDDQDVFVVQCWGGKQWQLYQPLVKLPYTEEMLGKDESVNPENCELVMECLLEEGDILYIPRGYLHEAKTAASLSLHVTVTIPTSDTTWGLCAERLIRDMVLSARLSANALDVCRSSFVKHQISNNNNNKHFDDVWNEIRQQATPQAMQQQLDKHMTRINTEQESYYKRYADARKHIRLPVYKRDAIKLQTGVSCTCNTEGTNVAFKKEAATLSMKICPSASRLLQALSDGKSHKICELPCADYFEAACVCQVLLSEGVVGGVVE
eukprot:GHVS01005126.1.p1 GENE.GHVS01005126.1~~GHVS01005126.1.p1  ORF type:complete len:388 (-),score=65.06 GHVS01005126.1:210-1373(-)